MSELKTRAVMAKDFRHLVWGNPRSVDSWEKFEKVTDDLLRQRDAMVIEACAIKLEERREAYESLRLKNQDGHIPEGQLVKEVERCIDSIRAIGEQLK